MVSSYSLFRACYHTQIQYLLFFTLFAELTVNCFLITECLDLDLADVDCQIELIYTPVREDGLQGSPRSAISDIILPGLCFFTNCLIVVLKLGL